MTDRIIGPLTPPEIDGVSFRDLGDRLVLRAERDLSGVATKWFADPAIAVDLSPVNFQAPDVSMLGFAYTQFALPVRAAAGEALDFAPASNLNSPPAVMPLMLASSDGRFELLAPLGAWHEQIIAVGQQAAGIESLRWGWHGDLDEVSEGFVAELGIFTGTSPADVWQAWGAQIRTAAGTERPSPDIDPLLTHLSYWTDNGAAYWYRTEPELDLTTTLRNKLDELAELGVPARSVELDSWFYPHEISRSVSEVGYPEKVPPTGMMSWTPRDDVLPDGVVGLRQALGDPPLVLHSRHISPESPYLETGDWWVDLAAHPVDPSFFRRWFDDAAAWGATCIEQDWMMISFFGTRDLRSVPGRPMAWQRALDDAAASTDLTLLWCMALPGDFAATVELDRVIAIRTSDDYRFAADPALLWVWYLTVNSMASALELPVFKDCFFSSADPGSSAIDGDPYAELEALLSAMSAGVVGVGDRIGRTDVDVLGRVCRRDGRIVGPDQPITLADRSFMTAGIDGQSLCWASTSSGAWTYLVAINTATERGPIADSFDLGELGVEGDVLVYDWRNQRAEAASVVAVDLEARDWALFVCCPISDDGEGRTAVIGDPSKYVTMSRARVDHTTFDVLLAEDEAPTPVLRWSERQGMFV